MELHHKIKELKAIFIDLDGTLIDSKNHNISNVNIEAIEKAKQNGIEIIVSTGRSYDNSEMFAKVLNLNYLICANGGEIYRVDGTLLKQHCISLDIVKNIIDEIKSRQLPFMLHGNRTIYGVKFFLTRWLLRKYDLMVHRDYENIDFNETTKIRIIGSKKTLLNLSQKINKKFGAQLSIVFQGRALEISDFNATKGKALTYLSNNFLNINNKMQLAHIGDSGNDATVLGHAGYIFAMNNSSNSFKNVATHVGPNYKNGGLAKLLFGQIKSRII